MRAASLGLLSCLAIAVLGSSASAAVINEMRTDQSGGDNSEYFELFGSPGESLDGLTYLVIGDGSGGSGTIEAVVDLTGMSIPASGYFLAAESTFENGAGMVFEGVTPDLVTNINFENSDNTTHLLVSGFTGANADDLDTNDDGVLDSMPWSSIVDGVALIEEANPPSGTEYEYGTSLGLEVLGPDGSFVPGQAYRKPDGGPFVIGAFTLGETDTPGATNIPEPSSLLVALMAASGMGAVAMRRRLG